MQLRRMLLAACCLLLAGMAPAAPFAPGTELSDQEMGTVSAREGILLDVYLRNNVTDTFVPVCGTPTIGTPVKCLLALEFADRPGVYLMWKEFYGTLRLKELRLDAHTFPATNTAYVDNSRFLDAAGNCLIPGKTVANCNPASTPALKFTFPAADAQNVYDDLTTLLNIGRAWLEYDQATPFVPGYNRDTSLNSVYQLRLADSSGTNYVPDPENPPNIKLSNNSPAQMRFWGQAYVFGF